MAQAYQENLHTISSANAAPSEVMVFGTAAAFFVAGYLMGSGRWRRMRPQLQQILIDLGASVFLKAIDKAKENVRT